ncbi:hypothetical protein ACHAXT_001130 [Thalassiosira profunda]
MSLEHCRRHYACCIPHSNSDAPISLPDDDGSESEGRPRRACRYLKGHAPASPSLVIKSGPHGHHAVASQDIAAGSVIVQCLPLAHSILTPPGSSILDEEDDDDGTRRRCARCFAQEGDEDASGARKEKFGRCSKCRARFYCSRSCQAGDWAEQHKLECRYFVKRRKQSRTAGIPLHNSGPEEDAIPLILRTFCSLKRIRDESNDESAKEAGDAAKDDVGHGLVSCVPDHFASLMVSLEEQRSNNGTAFDGSMGLARDLMEAFANGPSSTGEDATTKDAASICVWGYEADSNKDGRCTPDQAIRRTLDAFRRNNFGIVNSLHSPIGEGVYPCAALLNHSCWPNCILRYKLGSKKDEAGTYHPPILQIVACRDIVKGEELCHSYVDLALNTKERQARLLDTHGFVCDCARCEKGGCTIELPEDREKWTLYPLTKEFQASAASGETKLDLVNVDIEDAMTASSGLSEVDIARITEQSQMLQQRASQLMIEGNTDGELHSLQQATNMYTAPGKGKWVTPFHTQLYSARCAYLSALIPNGRIEPAVEQCEHIVSFLAVAFSHVVNHPLLGLQLYTLGDLCAALASMEDGDAARGSSLTWDEKSKVTYQWAKRIMIVTHGVDDPMVKTLEHNISNTN